MPKRMKLSRILPVAEPTINHAVLVGVNDVPLEAFNVVLEELSSTADVARLALKSRYKYATNRDMESLSVCLSRYIRKIFWHVSDRSRLMACAGF